ncbi:PHD zinc finger-containing protein [Tieghemostelium lacteum]|uniref:PHD zinc finger-containing protein n=1 Tax=Tieghemostelium lacteum TaxID=361077 RepID=A0A151ZSS0_TIELA|nr:PHD zinc finger-containing protein [Tieghemostelium lacteum]|eukprot:KYQ96958.1 PHD zinc finger-containing protein [Tieghemostelium lacteum]
MDIDALCLNLNITNKKVINKSKEFVRLSKVKLPAGLGPSEICRPAACLTIACQVLENEIDRNKAVKLSGGSEKLFHTALSSLHNILGIKKRLSILEIAIEFNQIPLVEPSDNLLEKYKSKFLAGIPELQAKFVDFSSAEISAAVFFIMSCQNEITIDKNKLIEYSKCNPVEFQRVINSIKEYCYTDSPFPTSPKLKLTLKSTKPVSQAEMKKQKDEMNKLDENRVNKGDLSLEQERKIIKKKKENSYKEWKTKVLQDNQQSNLKIKSLNQSNSRQERIDNFFNLSNTVDPIPVPQPKSNTTTTTTTTNNTSSNVTPGTLSPPIIIIDVDIDDINNSQCNSIIEMSNPESNTTTIDHQSIVTKI